MLEQQDNVYIVECDICGVSERLHSDFEESKAQLSALGWSTVRRKAWLHFCPKCKD